MRGAGRIEVEQPTDDELLALENEQILEEANEYVSRRMTQHEKLMWLAGDRPQEWVQEFDAQIANLIIDNGGDALVWAGLYEKIEGLDGVERYYPLGEPDEEAVLKALTDYRRRQFGLRS